MVIETSCFWRGKRLSWFQDVWRGVLGVPGEVGPEKKSIYLVVGRQTNQLVALFVWNCSHRWEAQKIHSNDTTSQVISIRTQSDSGRYPLLKHQTLPTWTLFQQSSGENIPVAVRKLEKNIPSWRIRRCFHILYPIATIAMLLLPDATTHFSHK